KCVVYEGLTDQPFGGWKVTRRRMGLNDSQPSPESQNIKRAHEASKQKYDAPKHSEDCVNQRKTVVNTGSDDFVDNTSNLKRDKIMASRM
ncbi:Unknown protein, partial [Striga hermonthica]